MIYKELVTTTKNLYTLFSGWRGWELAESFLDIALIPVISQLIKEKKLYSD